MGVPDSVIVVPVAEDSGTELRRGVHEFALMDAKHFFGERRTGHRGESIGTRSPLPDDHFPLAVFFKFDGTWRINVEELVWFWGKGNDVVGPAAVIAAAGVGDEDYLRLAVAVEVLAGVILIKNHVKPGCAEHDVSGTVV